MAFACRLYKSTGFNTINVPDKPSLLDSFSYVDTDVIDVISTYNNSVIRVKVSQAPEWQYYDYLRLGSGSNIANRAYYAITGFRFTSPDVIEFQVVQDAWLTLGGLDAFTNGEINILSGTTKRHHIPKSEDLYQDYSETDDMLIPSDPVMVMVSELVSDFENKYVTDNSNEINSVTLVRTGVDLSNLGAQLPETVTFATQSISGDVTGQIPSPADFCYPKGTPTFTTIGLVSGRDKGFIIDSSGNARQNTWGPGGTFSNSVDKNFKLPGESLYVIYVPTGQDYQAGPFGAPNTTNVQKGIQRARGMGFDTAITASYSLPQGAARSVDLNGTLVEYLGGEVLVRARKMLDGTVSHFGLNELFEFESWKRLLPDLNNIRAIKGEYFKYELISLASGEKTEFLGENICKDSTASNPVYNPNLGNSAKGAPIILTITDPRPDGRPYFAYYDDRNFINLYNNSIKGMKWTEAPIRYEVNSGAAVESRRIARNTQFTDASAHFNNLMAEADYNIGGINRVAETGGASVDSARRLYGWGFADDSTTDNFKIVQRAAYGGEEYYRDKIRRQIDRAAEEEEFFVNSVVQVPQINFPVNESIKEAVGNGAMLVRYTATPKDILKFDKILNMYGYKDTRSLDESMFNNRSQYNFIETAGVSFGGSAAKFLRDDLASMFNVGIRIWHVAPDPTLYVGKSNS